MRFVFFVLMVGCVGGDEAKESGDDSGVVYEDLGFDRLQTGCGPDDGLVPVVFVGLDGDTCDAAAPADEVWVRIMFNQMSGDATAGTTYELGGELGDLSVWVYPSGGTDFVSPASATVTLSTYTPGAEASGTFSAVLDDGSTVAGSFDADFCDLEMEPCG